MKGMQHQSMLKGRESLIQIVWNGVWNSRQTKHQHKLACAHYEGFAENLPLLKSPLK